MRLSVARWPGWLAATLAVVTLVLLPAAPASAHDVGGVGATNFHTTLGEVTPPVTGLRLRVIENGSRLELSNDTDVEVVIAGYAGEPYARVGPAGVFVNDNSPATYLNASRFSSTPVPPGVDSKNPPAWRQVADEPVLRWHDHRTHWMLTSLPPAVAAAPTQSHHISTWSIELDYGGRALRATGSLEWVPGPSPWPWFVLLTLIASAVAASAVTRRAHTLLGVATMALFAGDVLHGSGVMLVTAGSVPQRLEALLGADALVMWPLSILAAWLLWRGHSRAAWLSAGIGLTVAITLAIDDAPVWWRSSAPSALPPTVNRAVITLVVGLGFGLVAALPLLLRRHRPPARPWTEPAARFAVSSAASAESDRASASACAESDRTSAPALGGAPYTSLSVKGVPLNGTGVGRRGVVGYLAAGALGALAGAGAGAAVGTPRVAAPAAPSGASLADVGARTVPFYGDRQAGIAIPSRPQAYGWVGAFDVMPELDAAGLRDLLRRWSEAAAMLMAGQPLGQSDDTVVAGLGPAALTVTVGFGPFLFGKAGVPAAIRPAALAPLPAFSGERLDPSRSDGDLGVVVAADDPVVVEHAARVLGRLAGGAARLRWRARGFNAARGSGAETGTPRNLMGQVDGTNNPQPTDPDFETRIYAAEPDWLRGGSYLVVRRIRVLLDEWDRLPVAAQEKVIGRRKDTGAPLSGGAEHTPADFGARAQNGDLAIAPTAHTRLAAPAFNAGAAMLRRGFSYTDGDGAGLLFLAWQADPRTGFIPVQRRLVDGDALGPFIRHETSALFAMPGGVTRGAYVGQGLLERSGVR